MAWGSKLVRSLAKIEHTQKKVFPFANRNNDRSLKYAKFDFQRYFWMTRMFDFNLKINFRLTTFTVDVFTIWIFWYGEVFTVICNENLVNFKIAIANFIHKIAEDEIY